MQTISYRQFLVIFGLWCSAITDGFIFGQMSGMIDSLHHDKELMGLSEDDLSWIASLLNITCFCGIAIVGILVETLGRKRTLSAVTSPIILYWLIVSYGQNKFTLLSSRILIGFFYGGILLLIHISIGEYMPPVLRPILSNIISCIGISTGTLIGHILSILLNWRTVALIGILPTTLSAILPFFWVESPSWLASKGLYEECENSFKTLYKKNNVSQEVKMLVNTEKQKQKGPNRTSEYLKNIKMACRQKYFWEVTFLGIVTNLYRVASGRILFGTLAITILKEITKSTDILYFTFFVDGFVIIGYLISCALLCKFKMKTLLLTLGVVANLFLISLASVLYGFSASNVYMAWIKVFLLALYFTSVSAGPLPVLETILTEIFPLKIKAFCITIQGFICGIFQFLSVKMSPSMFLEIGYHGVFITHSLVMFLCLIYLWKFLPETNKRTLQEIEMYFKNKEYPNNSDNLRDFQTEIT
ncbi:uncharacterized protein LOC116768521 [Danaus plexippus]|uniref:uncharacterized protein LOC116768521 n=1 Tax=Danaus plexippus TaxID=13037 RepID=UPI002AAFC06D|nr:uncharacterized protein LOC116768521 [Danaus plexippus]